MIWLCERVDASSKPCQINKVVSMCLNQTDLCSRVNMRINGSDSSGLVSVFSARSLILNNNDFLMGNCDYIVRVKYRPARPPRKRGPKRELLWRCRLQQRSRWANLHKFKSNLERACSVIEKDGGEAKLWNTIAPKFAIFRYHIKPKKPKDDSLKLL